VNLREKMKRRLKLNRPSLRARARPPKQRTALGQQFTAANLPVSLSMQVCTACEHHQYPPAELCGNCLGDTLRYREIDTAGQLLSRSELHHSLWEFFKRRISTKPWPIGSVKLRCGPVIIGHLGEGGLHAGDDVAVFSHSDASQAAVLIIVSRATPIATPAQRKDIITALCLDEPAEKKGGI